MKDLDFTPKVAAQPLRLNPDLKVTRIERIGRKNLAFAKTAKDNPTTIAEHVYYGSRHIGDISIIEGKYQFKFKSSLVRAPIAILIEGKPVRDLPMARGKTAKAVQALLDMSNDLFSIK